MINHNYVPAIAGRELRMIELKEKIKEMEARGKN